MRIVAIVNQKGGCGKTTTAINLAGSLARLGHRTLLVDMDPQSHCAVGLGIPEEKIDLHIGDAMLHSPGQRLDESRLLWRVARNLELAPSAMKLAGLEAARGGLADLPDRDARLGAVIDRFADRYDWALVDCPPSIGLLTYNALRAATEVIIPVETSFFAMRGATRQVRTIRSLARRLGGKTPYRLLPTMHDADNRLAADLLAELESQFGELLLPLVIRLDSKLKEAAILGQPLAEFDPEARGALDYAALAQHLIDNPPGARMRVAPEALDDDRPIPSAGSRLAEAARAALGVVSAVRHGRREPVQATAVAEGASAAAPVPASDPPSPLSRAADLAARAQRLLARADAESDTPAEPATNSLRCIEEPKLQPPSPDTVSHVFGARETSRGVLFVHPGPRGQSVAIAGDFNNWSAIATPLRYSETLGVYEACVELPPGRIQYRMVINGRWVADPYNRNTTINPFGEANSFVDVTRAHAAALACEGAD